MQKFVDSWDELTDSVRSELEDKQSLSGSPIRRSRRRPVPRRAGRRSLLRPRGRTMIPNPLRDPRDRRLPRVPEPCALVVFGITGDLARKKLLPAVYDLANRGLLPTNFALLGFARRDWGDDGVRRAGPRGGPRARPHPVARGGVGAAGQRASRFVQGSFDDDNAFDQLAATLGELRGQPRHRRQRRVLPVHPAGDVPDRAQADAAHRHGREHAGPAGGGSSSRSRSATTCPPAASSTRWSTRCSPPTTSSASTTTWARRRSRTCWRCGSPTRCSSRSGTATTSTRCRSPWPRTSASAAGPAFYEKTGAARDVLQNHLLQLLALTAMEEPVEFSAEEIRTEKLKVLRAVSLPEDLETLRRPRPVRAGLAGRPAGRGLPAGGRRRPELEHRDLRRRPARRRDPPLGRACRSTCAPASGCPAGSPRSRWSFKRAPHLPFADDRHRGAGQQPAGRSASSPTRA